MHINELIDPDLLVRGLQDGLIRVREDFSTGYRLYNYTEKAQFSKHWNSATLNCRGLIVSPAGKIIARPFPKFFNWNEEKPKGSRFQMSMDEPVVVTDKIDGSLGILYYDSIKYRFATRGSFNSDQAVHAEQIWTSKYADFEDQINTNLTYLFEIVYPDNRIVVDYKSLDDLVLLGAVDKRSGHVYSPDFFPGWPGPSARVFHYNTLREAVNAKPRAGQEGFVVRSLMDNLMVKVKYDDYVSLHRVVTGLNEKEVWRRVMKADLGNGPEIDKLGIVLQDIPDELHEWVNGVALRLRDEVAWRFDEVLAVWNRAAREIDYDNHTSDRHRKKVFAEWLHQNTGVAVGHQKGEINWLKKALFMVYDGMDPKHYLWKLAEPKGDTKK